MEEARRPYAREGFSADSRRIACADHEHRDFFVGFSGGCATAKRRGRTSKPSRRPDVPIEVVVEGAPSLQACFDVIAYFLSQRSRLGNLSRQVTWHEPETQNLSQDLLEQARPAVSVTVRQHTE